MSLRGDLKIGSEVSGRCGGVITSEIDGSQATTGHSELTTCVRDDVNVCCPWVRAHKLLFLNGSIGSYTSSRPRIAKRLSMLARVTTVGR